MTELNTSKGAEALFVHELRKVMDDPESRKVLFAIVAFIEKPGLTSAEKDARMLAVEQLALRRVQQTQEAN